MNYNSFLNGILFILWHIFCIEYLPLALKFRIRGQNLGQIIQFDTTPYPKFEKCDFDPEIWVKLDLCRFP